MAPTAIINADIVLPDKVLENSSLTVEGDRIAAIGKEPPADAEVIDASGKYVLPGLIDIHTHGRMISLEPEAVRENIKLDSMEYARAGVTRFLPTLASAPVEAWLAAMPVFEEIVSSPPPGSAPIGVHYEGIFINAEARGAHPPELIRPFSKDDPDHRALFERWPDLVKLVTFAPEVPGNEKIIELCRGKEIVMSLGHSTASPGQVKSIADQGVTNMTHVFNGMKGIHHRDPGPPLAGLLDDRITVEIICDGFHIHPEIVRLIHRMKPPNKRVLITDTVTIQLPGAEPGKMDEPNVLPNGLLAGSRLRLCRGVRNYMDFTSCPLPVAAAMASLYPARILGMDDRLGSLEPGKTADLWIADRDLEPEAVIIDGEIVAKA